MPKTIAKRRRARPLERPERRTLLLECAIRVFARRGLGGARHSEIAREAKVSVPTVFCYFPTHEALVREVLEEVARFFTEMAETIHDQHRPAPEIILEHTRAFADTVATHPDYTRVLLEWSTALRDEVWPLYLQFQEKVIATIARTIRRWRMETGSQRDPDAEDDARVIAATGYVLVQMKVANMPSSRIERFVQTLVRDTLGEVRASAQNEAHLTEFNVAVG
ncbi:MAG: TetR/AcrR family transcriptional regulator [Candidatus Binatus sp.]|uniref:TetR/AcrR family transcriptional regulator n=1 Tax=Candidatus Binatus sp. TaxID=2811406 RepID=UPI002727627C|nr:TetR/AcrR family transcriptional regulator [Candidatus Binatus sp.]MDO8432106.1 TetR/AcrR family transcriptional regulator [Candidatus Binatus sp.]